MILVCGASGELGGRVARRLLALGGNVRLLLRAEADAGDVQELAAEVMRGDFRDRTSLERAVEGVTTVVSGVTAISRMLAGAERRDGLRAVDRDGHLALIEAAERAGAQRFVFVSTAGIERVPHIPLAQAKLAVEDRLDFSPLREVVARPDAFQEVWLSPAAGLDWHKGRLTIYGSGEAPLRYVAVDDVADAVARWALADDPPRRVEFGGPEALSPNEVATLIERSAGRPMKRRHVPRAMLAGGSRMLKPVKPALATLMGLGLMLDDGSRWDDAPLRELGIEARAASAYIAQTVGR